MKYSSQRAVAGRIPAIAGALATTALAAVLSVGTIPVSAYAVTGAEVDAQAQDVLAQITSMQETLDQLSTQYFQALDEYQVASESRDAAQARVDELTGEISDIQERLGSRAREMYRGGPSSMLDLLLGSTSFLEFANNWDFLNRMNQSDADLSVQVKALRTESEEQKAEYGKQADLAAEKSEEAAEAYAEAQDLIAQMEETYNSLSAEAQELYAQEAAAAAAAAQAAAEAEAAAYEQQLQQMAAEQGGAYENADGTVTDAQTGETYASASEYSEATGNEVVDRARAMLGSNYVWGGVGGSSGGFDCSGLVSYALTGSNTRLGTTATFASWNQVSDPQPGDVCVIHNGSSQHTGIYIGNGKMIHAATEGVGVVESDVQKGMIYVRR